MAEPEGAERTTVDTEGGSATRGGTLRGLRRMMLRLRQTLVARGLLRPEWEGQPLRIASDRRRANGRR